MPKKQEKPKNPGRRGDPVSLAPLTMDEAVDAIFAIKPTDVKTVLASKLERKKK